jgi:prephenate dehydratase
MNKITLHTLGPTNTNCEAAAKYYLDKNNLDGEIILYETLESAVDIVANDKDALLLTCIVYPKLNKLVFDNLEKLKLVDCFIFNTFEMVLSTKKEVELSDLSTIISHPAPTPLINKFGKEISLANSNSEAAKLCFDEKFDACVTTMPASKFYNLKILKNFGEVPMGFAIHTKL